MARVYPNYGRGRAYLGKNWGTRNSPIVMDDNVLERTENSWINRRGYLLILVMYVHICVHENM